MLGRAAADRDTLTERALTERALTERASILEPRELGRVLVPRSAFVSGRIDLRELLSSIPPEVSATHSNSDHLNRD